MGGSKETQFLEDLSRLAGEYDRDKISTTRGSGNRSRQTAEHTDRVWQVGDLRQIPDGRALMLYQRLPAAVVRPAHLVHRQPSRPAACRPRRRPRRTARPRTAMSGSAPRPLEWRVNELEKNLSDLSTSSPRLNAAVKALAGKIDPPAGKDTGPSRWAWQHATADQAAWLWAGLVPWVRWLTDTYPSPVARSHRRAGTCTRTRSRSSPPSGPPGGRPTTAPTATAAT